MTFLKKKKWKESHLKTPIELYLIETMTKLLHCSEEEILF